MEYLDVPERIRMSVQLGESHFREFKSAIHRRPGKETPREVRDIARDIANTLVAFANADGGELIVGIEDDGTMTGIPHGERHLSIMSQSVKTHVLESTPLPSPRVMRVGLKGNLEGRHLLYFSVPKGTEFVHLTADGRCLRRYDRESRPVSSEEIRYDRAERRSREYDREFIPDASTSDLDPDQMAEVANRILPGASAERLLQYFDLAEYGLDGLRIRRSALLLFAKEAASWHPRCQIRVIEVPGTEVLSGPEYKIRTSNTVAGNLFTILRSTWDDVLRQQLAIERLGARGVFSETVLYPEEACLEAIINAVAHRDYSIEGRGIEIYIFEDRMEVRSPGGLLSTVSLEQLRRREHVHESRNAYVARVLREYGLMRELGEGIPRIFAAMEARNYETPDIDSADETFTITLYNRSAFSHRDQIWLGVYSSFDLSQNEQKVLLLARDGHALSQSEIRNALNITDEREYRELIERMTRKGLIHSPLISKELTRVAAAQRKDRKDVGRFYILPLAQLEPFYEELLNGLRHLGPRSHIEAEELRSILRGLSGDNPYRRASTDEHTGQLARSLKYLGFIDVNRQPEERLKELWASRTRA